MENKELFVYSGKCKVGRVGDPTILEDFTKKPLFVGDIVMTSIIDEFGICDNCGLSVVVDHAFNNPLTGRNETGHFVMGIVSIDFMGKDSEKWIVKKVKSFEDVIDGEHWKDYGFNYKAELLTALDNGNQ